MYVNAPVAAPSVGIPVAQAIANPAEVVAPPTAKSSGAPLAVSAIPGGMALPTAQPSTFAPPTIATNPLPLSTIKSPSLAGKALADKEMLSSGAAKAIFLAIFLKIVVENYFYNPSGAQKIDQYIPFAFLEAYMLPL